jgi:hypothetical protein
MLMLPGGVARLLRSGLPGGFDGGAWVLMLREEGLLRVIAVVPDPHVVGQRRVALIIWR